MHPSPVLFFDTINAFQRTEALRAAVELELFTHLARGADTAPALANACGGSERGVRILADYLTVIGFLRKSGERYRLTPDAATLLDKESPAYLGGATEFLLAPQLKDCFGQLAAAVRKVDGNLAAMRARRDITLWDSAIPVDTQLREASRLGVPLTLLRAGAEHRAVVVEMGMRGLGEIERLSRSAEPDIAVITNIGTAHLELLSSREAIAAALGRPGLDVLELRTDRDRNVAQHQQVWAHAVQAVRDAVVAARA